MEYVVQTDIVNDIKGAIADIKNGTSLNTRFTSELSQALQHISLGISKIKEAVDRLKEK